MKEHNILDPQSLVDQITKQDEDRAEAVRLKAEKDSRVRNKYDKFRLWLYVLLVKMAAWNQRHLQALINKRNKYSETYIVHDSVRLFAEMMQGDQLSVLKELNLISAKKIHDSRMMLTFGEIIRDDAKQILPDEGMFLVIDAIDDNGAPFLKIGMDTWEKSNDSARNN